jgi:hypothetical protein
MEFSSQLISSHLTPGPQKARPERGLKQNRIVCWEYKWEVWNLCQSCILPLPLKMKYKEKSSPLTLLVGM